MSGEVTLTKMTVQPYLVSALVLLTRDDGLRQHRVQGELRHSPPKFRQLSGVRQGAQGI